MDPPSAPLVTTIQERCRLCYTCVRECPAKAIRVTSGQAEVLPDRCIGCGNCVRVCARGAKRVLDEIDLVEELLASGAPVAAMLAPSFPAEFTEVDYEYVVGMIRSLGFHLVVEVGFGADLVAAEYQRLLHENPGKRYIATTCPAIVGFVERYHPELVPMLAPVVSPMLATARALHRLHGDGLRLVFIGPCIAKKGEAFSAPVSGEVDAALTFIELEEMLQRHAIKPESVSPSDFDPPHAGVGALFPISRGMLQAAQLPEDLLAGEVVAADGHSEFVEAIREFEHGDLQARLLEVLCCNGCIMGPGISGSAPLFNRRAQVSRYVKRRIYDRDREHWHEYWSQLIDLDMRRTFTPHDRRVGAPSADELSEILGRMGKFSPEDELNCGACGYETCRAHAVAVYKGLAESEMCLPNTIEQLKQTCKELEVSNQQLATTQEALMQSEKLASMGQLAAGIAHEVNNPLGTVLMLSHTLLEELKSDGRQREDLTLIASEADRCRKIVSGLLQFARKNKVETQPTNVCALVDRTARTLCAPTPIKVQVDHADRQLEADLDRDQVTQVLTNLIQNAIDAMPDGGTLTLRTAPAGEDIRIQVIDTGCGIPPEQRKQIFEPFFTTKPAGKGTGLGLSVTYGIVKMHSGDIRVESNADSAAGPTGTIFTVMLPRRRRLDSSRGGGAMKA
ncbi:MAG: [Fe-Fe] hydrogenase large subunit C-terminal domain-containing protein [Phycisphaerae bacterium]|jgi:iron only hydrogenase large subunit-like protein/nitrogen-specific signal transduction histidine kinase